MTSKIELVFDVERSDTEAKGSFLCSSDVDAESLKNFIVACAIKRFYLRFQIDDFFVTLDWGNGHKLDKQTLWSGSFHLFNQSMT